MSFLPGSLTPAFRSLWCAHIVASLRRRTYPIRTVIQLLDVEKQKEPITQSIRNRREYNSRFKVMFYVIGSENSKSGSASYSSCQQNQRQGGAVRHFSEHRIRVGQTRHLSIWSNIFIQLLCSGVPLCHYYTDNALCRQGCETLSLYSEFQKANFNGCRKVLFTC